MVSSQICEEFRVVRRTVLIPTEATDGKKYWFRSIWCFEQWTPRFQKWDRTFLGEKEPIGLLEFLESIPDKPAFLECHVEKFYREKILQTEGCSPSSSPSKVFPFRRDDVIQHVSGYGDKFVIRLVDDSAYEAYAENLGKGSGTRVIDPNNWKKIGVFVNGRIQPLK